MLNGKAPPPAAADCKNPLEKNMELGRKLEVTGTPTIVFADGRRMPGAVPLDKIEATFKEISGK
jgi:thiol:disulfide interchange protein DsbC